MTKLYTFDEIENLMNKINKIKNKKYLEKIRDIILHYNPKVQITENSNGIFIYFHNLFNPDTYLAINNFIKNIHKNPPSSDNNSDIKLSYNDSHSDIKLSDNLLSKSIDDQDTLYDNSKLKYSNKEKNIIRRKNYNEILQDLNHVPKKDDNSDFNNNNIFIKKNIKKN